MVYILSSDPVRTVMRVRGRQRGSGRRRQRGSGRRRQRGSGRRRQRGGRRRQRGNGLGDVVKAVAGKIIPFAKQAGKYVLREGLQKAPGLLLSKDKTGYLKKALKDSTLHGVQQLANKLARGSVRKLGPRRKHPGKLRARVI